MDVDISTENAEVSYAADVNEANNINDNVSDVIDEVARKAVVLDDQSTTTFISTDKTSSNKVEQTIETSLEEVNDDENYYIIPDDISKSPEEGPTQPRLDSYPKTMLGPSRSRSFSANWYSRFPWLEYSISNDKVYCFACRHYSNVLYKPSPSDQPGKKHSLRKGATIYATTGFCRWAKAHERMQRHNSSARHLEAMSPWLADTLVREEQGSSSNGTLTLAIQTNNDTESALLNDSFQGPLPSKRKRSRPTKKSIFSTDEYDGVVGCPSWCTCTKCTDMSKMHECVCCCDVPEIRSKVDAWDSTLLCITNHPGFAAVCLNKWAVQVAYYQHKQESGIPSVNEEHERFRYIAYCQFVRWCWGFLREDMHIPLPSCVVNNIKAIYHSKAELPPLDDLPKTSQRYK